MNYELVSWGLNIISNSLWLTIFLPQLYINYKLKNSEAISLSLLLLLIFGEILAITSGFCKNLHVIVLLTGFYHIFFEIILAIQIIYYRHQHQNQNESEMDEFTQLLYPENTTKSKLFSRNEKTLIYTACLIYTIFIICMISSVSYNEILGDLIAWLATIIFTVSRIPQIILNYTRKSTEGLAILSFIILMLSSVLYLISIMLVNEILDIIQWIIGMMLSLLLFDSILIYQFFKYK